MLLYRAELYVERVDRDETVVSFWYEVLTNRSTRLLRETHPGRKTMNGRISTWTLQPVLALLFKLPDGTIL
jgi:hypothetical protein